MENRPGTTTSALLDRMASIYPLLLATVVVGWFVFPETPVLPLITTLYNVTSAQPDYHDPYTPLWTLGVIVQFSIVLAIAWKAAKNARRMSLFLGVWIVLGIAFGLVLDGIDGDRFIELNYKSVITRGMGMCVGGLIALHGAPRLTSRNAIVVAILSWLAAVYCYSFVNGMVAGVVPFTVVQILLSVAAASLITAVLNSEQKQGARVWSVLARYTFAFYVLQYPALYAFRVFSSEGFDLSTIFVALLFCATLSLAAEHLLAAPFKQLARRKTKALN